MADVRAVVSEPGGSTVQILDLTTTTVLATLTGLSTPGAIAVLPNATQAYVANGLNIPGHVYPIALPAYTSGATLIVGNEPGDIAASPDGTHVYTVNDISPDGTVTPIATPSNTVQPDITLTGSVGPRGIAVNPSSTTAYVTCSSGVNRGIIPIAIPSNVVGASFAVSIAASNPLGLSITPDGLTAYVASFSAGGIYPVNLVTQTVGSLITLTGSSFISNCYVTPDGTQVFIPDGGTNTVYVVSTATNLQTHAVSLTPLTGVPNRGGFDSAGAFFYTAVSSSGAIAAVSTSTYAASSVFTGLAGPDAIAIIPTPGPPPTPPYPARTSSRPSTSLRRARSTRTIRRTSWTPTGWPSPSGARGGFLPLLLSSSPLGDDSRPRLRSMPTGK